MPGRGRPCKRPNVPLLPNRVEPPTTRVSADRLVITPAKIEIILQTVRMGGSPRDGAMLAGLSATRISHLVHTDLSFAKKLACAEIECKMHHIEQIYNGEKAWQAAAWFLERRWAREFSVGAGATEEERTVYVRRVIRNKPSHSVQEKSIEDATNKGGGMTEFVEQQQQQLTDQSQQEEQ